MATTPNPNEELTSLEKRVTELEKALKAALKREVTLARRLVAAEKQLKSLDTAHGQLRSHVAQVQQRRARDV